MARLTPPLNPNLPMTDKDGKPTPFFMRWWQEQAASNNAITNLSTAENVTAVLDVLDTAAHGQVMFRGATLWEFLDPDTTGKLLTTKGADADPVWETVSDLIDSNIGNTRGDILYRGATGWEVLPAGTADQLLSTAGPGADPLWVDAPAGGGGASGGQATTVLLDRNFATQSLSGTPIEVNVDMTLYDEVHIFIECTLGGRVVMQTSPNGSTWRTNLYSRVYNGISIDNHDNSNQTSIVLCEGNGSAGWSVMRAHTTAEQPTFFTSQWSVATGTVYSITDWQDRLEVCQDLRFYRLSGNTVTSGRLRVTGVNHGGGGGGGASAFTDLTDTPGTLGTVGQVPAVNAGATALEWVDAGSGGGIGDPSEFGTYSISTGDTITAGVDNQIQFDTEDKAASWGTLNTSTGVVTMAVAGSYTVKFAIHLTAGSATGATMRMGVKVNGAKVVPETTHYHDFTWAQTMNGAIDIDVLVSDTVEIYFTFDTAGPTDTISVAGKWTWMQILQNVGNPAATETGGWELIETKNFGTSPSTSHDFAFDPTLYDELKLMYRNFDVTASSAFRPATRFLKTCATVLVSDAGYYYGRWSDSFDDVQKTATAFTASLSDSTALNGTWNFTGLGAGAPIEMEYFSSTNTINDIYAANGFYFGTDITAEVIDGVRLFDSGTSGSINAGTGWLLGRKKGFGAAGGGGGASAFVDLTDTPVGLGSAFQMLQVNAGATALEFVAPPAGTTTFTGLTDTPGSFGTAGQIPVVNTGATALEFVDNISFLPVPDNLDESDVTYFYFGWTSVLGGWLVQRQTRSSSLTLTANIANNGGTPDLATAWPNRAILTYS